MRLEHHPAFVCTAGILVLRTEDRRQRASPPRRNDNARMAMNSFGAVYGTISVAALLAAESAMRESYPETVGAVVVTLLMYWLAHSYAELASERLQSGERLTLRSVARTMAGELTILIGAAVPLLAVVACWIAGASIETGVTVGVWTSAAMIVVLELAIGLNAELSGRELAAQVAIGALLGLLVIAVRLILH